MALNEQSIKDQIGTLIDSTDLDVEEAKEQFKILLADIIINAIKSATITIPSGAINTVGSQSAQSNITPVVVNNGIS